jgi:uncharacterized membrane protein YidH (DUF202 family)
MTMLGPVYNAAHSDPTIGDALFCIGVGLSVLSYGWLRFFRTEDAKPKPLGNMIGISLICCTMIALGVWEWVRALRISN